MDYLIALDACLKVLGFYNQHTPTLDSRYKKKKSDLVLSTQNCIEFIVI